MSVPKDAEDVIGVRLNRLINNDPQVAVSTVDCRFARQSPGVWLITCRAPVQDRPVVKSCMSFASQKQVGRTG